MGFCFLSSKVPLPATSGCFDVGNMRWLYVMCCTLCISQEGGHHTNEEFAVRGKEPKDEVQIYTWKDATLRELTDLVR